MLLASAMLLARLLLVAAAVGGASLAARRGGHAVAGLITGLPVIVGPIMGLLLLDHPPDQVRAIALAALTCVPATLLHTLTFAWLARRWRWPACLAGATAVYLLAGAALGAAGGPAWLTLAAAALAPGVAWRLMPADARQVRGGVPIPAGEIVWRIAAAVAVAGAVLLGAGRLPDALSGLLVAVPIAGSVLPCFTLPRHGPAATAALLRGFARGMHGFAAFLITLWLALAAWPAAAAWVAGLLAAAAVAAWLRRATEP
ncbi:MAG TPA: hypothetical protein VLA16_13505 [Ideonella sp.]|nr:hypothetical protein [Ideonella sp.]